MKFDTSTETSIVRHNYYLISDGDSIIITSDEKGSMKYARLKRLKLWGSQWFLHQLLRPDISGDIIRGFTKLCEELNNYQWLIEIANKEQKRLEKVKQ